MTTLPEEHRLKGNTPKGSRSAGSHPSNWGCLAGLGFPRKGHWDVNRVLSKGLRSLSLGMSNSRMLEAISEYCQSFQMHISFVPHSHTSWDLSYGCKAGMRVKMYVQGYKHCLFVKQKPGKHPSPYQKKTNKLWSMYMMRSQGEGRMKNHWLLVWASPRHTVECKETKYRILSAVSLWVKGWEIWKYMWIISISGLPL